MAFLEAETCSFCLTEDTLYIVQLFSLNVQPEDGLLEAETCSC